ncbi:MAG: GNAT family N-acetyltransferase [Parasphingorhabdus sp.]
MNTQNDIILRSAKPGEHAILTDLCMRSKAVWGYDEQFMERCRVELTLNKAACTSPNLRVAERIGTILGIAEIATTDDGCFLEKLFVDPQQQSAGVGRILFDWSKNRAATLRQDELIIEADPGAVGFYRKMGATLAGETASQSISGRSLPKLVLPLSPI